MMYADTQKLHNGASCAQRLSQHFGDTEQIFDANIVSESMFGAFPLAYECAKKTQSVHNIMHHNVVRLQRQCAELAAKTLDTVDQLSQCDNDSAQLMHNLRQQVCATTDKTAL